MTRRVSAGRRQEGHLERMVRFRIADQCRRHIRHVARMAAAFPGLPIGDPVWSILIELRLARAEMIHGLGALPTSAIGLLTQIAPTTVLRHLDSLERRGLVIRIRDQSDGRRTFVAITDDCARRVDAILMDEAAA